MTEHGEIPLTLDAFLAQLEEVEWFSNLGAPTPPDARVVRMLDWDDWPGPEEPAVEKLTYQQQELLDRIMAETNESEELGALWDRVYETVFQRASPRVPYDPDQDAWHAPTAAVWSANWTAGLVALCLRTGRELPPELREQWRWFIRGHWPAGYASLDDPGWLLVY
jgi:hypothetical protein